MLREQDIVDLFRRAGKMLENLADFEWESLKDFQEYQEVSADVEDFVAREGKGWR